jgi:hypothetical protein
MGNVLALCDVTLGYKHMQHMQTIVLICHQHIFRMGSSV